MDEQIFLEAIARVSDTVGRIWITGSLGIQYTNPKNHWLYRRFKETTITDSEIFEWHTGDNPYFPKEELERLKYTLDGKSYRALFEINWDIQPSNVVYEDFSKENLLQEYKYDPLMETSVCIDWGFAHPAAALFFQYDPSKDRVILFDEIVQSKLLLEDLHNKILAKPYKIHNWYCDIAGNQEREQTGYSNINWFRNKNIHFKFRTSAITHGITIVRAYIKNSKGQRRLYLVEPKVPKTIDGLRNYSYAEKNGMLVNELPVKKDDDVCDSLRYYFVNRHDFTRPTNQFQEFSRWKAVGK